MSFISAVFTMYDLCRDTAAAVAHVTQLQSEANMLREQLRQRSAAVEALSKASQSRSMVAVLFQLKQGMQMSPSSLALTRKCQMSG